MGITGADINGNRLATAGNVGNSEQFRKVTRTKSLWEDYSLLCFGFVILCGMLTFDVSWLLESNRAPFHWGYLLSHLIPVFMMSVATYAIRHELNLRKRVENGEVEIFVGSHCIFIIPTENKNRLDEIIKNAFSSHKNTSL